MKERMKIQLCAGGVLLGTVPARTLLFTQKQESGRTLSKAISVPEAALPSELAPTTELALVPVEQLRNVAKLAGTPSADLYEWEVDDRFQRIAALVGVFLEGDGKRDAVPVQDRFEVAAELLENQAREFARSGLGDVASVMMSLVGAIKGKYHHIFARAVIEAADYARARAPQVAMLTLEEEGEKP